MASAVIGGAIVAAGALASSYISSQGAKDANAQSMSFTGGENAQNRAFAEYMYNKQFAEGNKEYDRRQQQSMAQSKELTSWLYEMFNSPSAQVAALRKAGINPAAAFASGGSGFSQQLQEAAQPSVTAPSGVTAGTSNSVNLQNPAQYYKGAIGEIASAFAQMQQGIKTREEAETISKTRDAIITDLVLKNSGQEIANQFSEFHLNLDKAFSSKKIVAEIKKLEADAVTSYYSGKHQEALSKLVDIQSLLAKYQDKCNTAMLPYLEENCKQIALSYQFENRVKQAQEAAQRAMASASYASANLSNKQAEGVAFDNVVKRIQAEGSLKAKKEIINDILEKAKSSATSAKNERLVKEIDNVRQEMWKKNQENDFNRWFDSNLRYIKDLFPNIPFILGKKF